MKYHTTPIICLALAGLIGLLLACGQGPLSGEPSPAPAPTASRAAPTVNTLQGNVYYVAPNGDDSNDGSEAYPWQTIQKAADTLAAGETVYIKAGTYPERVIPQNSGSVGNLIVYASYPGHTVTIDGSGISLPDDLAGLFELSGKSYIKISGLRIANTGPNADNAGILVNDSSYITIENNYTYNTSSSGIGVWGSHHILIDGNKVELACGGGGQECISVAGTDAFEVRNNEVLQCHKEGLDAKDGASNGKIYKNHVHHTQAVGIYVDAWDKHTYNIEVFQNIVHDVADNNGFSLASEMGGLLENIKLYNNLAYHNRYCGVAVTINGDAPQHPMNNIHVINNTFYDNGWTEWGGGITVYNPDAQNVVVRNNLVSQNLYFQIALDPAVPTQSVTIDHNLIDGYRGTEGETYGNDYVEGDPQFANAAAANFHLRPGSPAIDAGSPVNAPSNDFDGATRPLDGNDDGTPAYDMGAYEAPLYSSYLYLPTVSKNAPTAAWQPPLYTTWQWQLDGPIDLSFDVAMYDIDLFDNDASVVAALHAQGRKLVCYINVGAWEEWRPDQDQFPASVIGNDYAGWPGEKWLDIRQIDLLAPVMRARFDQCKAKGFDAIEPDNIDSYTNDTGFPLTYQDQLNYDLWLANEAHARGLSIGLKNNSEQVSGLLPYFDWALTEDCFAQGWCSQLAPFVAAGKAVFAAEYTDEMTLDQFLNQVCPQANTMNFNAILKNRDLDAWQQACP